MRSLYHHTLSSNVENYNNLGDVEKEKFLHLVNIEYGIDKVKLDRLLGSMKGENATHLSLDIDAMVDPHRNPYQIYDTRLILRKGFAYIDNIESYDFLLIFTVMGIKTEERKIKLEVKNIHMGGFIFRISNDNP